MAPTPPPPEPPQLLSNTAAMRVKILVIRRITGLEKTDRLNDRVLIKGIVGSVDLESWFKAGLAHFFMARLVYRIFPLTARRAIDVVSEPRDGKRQRDASDVSQNLQSGCRTCVRPL